jgi:ComF family protein
VGKAMLRAFLNLIYPPRCYVCGKPSEKPLCAICHTSIELIKPPICEKCGKPVARAVERCRDCRERRISFSQARSLAIFDGTLKEAIHALKYRRGRRLSQAFTQLMVSSLNSSFAEIDLITFVPMSRGKKRMRGFNQAELLARGLARKLQKPVKPLLVCTRFTMDQSRLSPAERRANVRGAFELLRNTESSRRSLAGKKILLIDDVYTTGCTVNECALVLRRAGAHEVRILTLARTVLT